MRLITDILRDIRRGRAIDEASFELAEVVRAVDATKQPGEVTITIKVEPSKHGGNEKTLTAKVKAKKPLENIAPAVFFSNAAGDLLRTDPNQEEMRFTDAADKSTTRQ